MLNASKERDCRDCVFPYIYPNLLQRDRHGGVVPPIFAGGEFDAVHLSGDLRGDVEDVDVLAAA